MQDAADAPEAMPRGTGAGGRQDPHAGPRSRILTDQQGGQMACQRDTSGRVADEAAGLEEALQERVQFGGREHGQLRQRGMATTPAHAAEVARLTARVPGPPWPPSPGPPHPVTPL
jgi:hypothetical protein